MAKGANVLETSWTEHIQRAEATMQLTFAIRATFGMRTIFAALLSLLIAPKVLVQAQFTDGARSLATGTGLQYATTGVLAQFTITAIDESGLRRTLGGDDFIVELDGTRTLSGSVSHDYQFVWADIGQSILMNRMHLVKKSAGLLYYRRRQIIQSLF